MTKYARRWLKRLLGLTPWARMHRKAFLQGFEEGLKVAGQLQSVIVGADGESFSFGLAEQRYGPHGQPLNKSKLH